MNEFRLDGRRALVTGGSRGIGLGIGRAMAAAGAEVILVARAGDELEGAAAAIQSAGYSASTCPFDFHETGKIAAWYDELITVKGRPDILVNAAGITRRAPAENVSIDDWNETLTVNLTAVFLLCQAFARCTIAARAPARIINIASLMTVAARKTTAAYAASKGGIGQLTKALAVDWADKGINVNAIIPGYIHTKLTEALWTDRELNEWVIKRTPLGRWGNPEDVAMTAVFLAAPASGFITGQLIFVDGGWMATF